MNRDPELMNLFWTTAGIHPGDGEISPYDFKDRVESAARAGFAGIGLWHTDLEHILATRTPKEVKKILDDNGIKYVELEFLTDWFLDGERKWDSDNRKRRLLKASEAINAKHIKIGDFYSSSCPMSHLIESFAALCKEAEDYGATIGFEVMKCAMINTLKDAMTMIEAAAPKNGGTIIDIVQQVNLGMTFEEISRIPLKYLVCVELNDGYLPIRPDHDMAIRKFCGEGEFDIKGFINCIQNMGYKGPWALEVFNREYLNITLDELNTRAFKTTMAQFADK